MNYIKVVNSDLNASAIISGCMRFGEFSTDQMVSLLHTALDNGINFFDHADIYAGGKSEEVFGKALKADKSLKREDMIIQSKCGIRNGFFDFSKEHILSSVDGILSRLQLDYLDVLLLHRPDALVEPEEVAAAFDKLMADGKVRNFGVSNQNPMQMELLKKYVKQPLIFNQLQYSIPVSNMVAQGLEVNMDSNGATNRDGSVLDYCRLNDVTIQAWSPFQKANWRGCFVGDAELPELNAAIDELALKYNATPTQIATAWILRHPAKMQVIAGTTNPKRLAEIADACRIELTRQEWYKLYLAAGHILP